MLLESFFLAESFVIGTNEFEMLLFVHDKNFKLLLFRIKALKLLNERFASEGPSYDHNFLLSSFFCHKLAFSSSHLE